MGSATFEIRFATTEEYNKTLHQVRGSDEFTLTIDYVTANQVPIVKKQPGLKKKSTKELVPGQKKKKSKSTSTKIKKQEVEPTGSIVLSSQVKEISEESTQKFLDGLEELKRKYIHGENPTNHDSIGEKQD